MELKIFFDRDREEEVLIYAHEKTELVRAIEQLVTEDAMELLGYKGKEVVCLHPAQVYCFVVENNKTFAICHKERLHMKYRLYQLQERLGDNFIKLNQSCVANIQQIERFDASLSGTLRVKFKNGYCDYVSRRNLRSVKERLGL